LAGMVEGDEIIPDPFNDRIVIEVAVAVAGAADIEGFDLDGYRKGLEKRFAFPH
jgi:hypothetical protein